MKAIKILSVFLSLTFACGFLYLTGCTSAESTTGKLAFSQKDYQKAAIELKKGLMIDQNDTEGLYMLGYSQIEIGDFDSAKVTFIKLKKLTDQYNDKIKQYWIDKYNGGASEFGNGIDAEKRKSANFHMADSMKNMGNTDKEVDYRKKAVNDSLAAIKSYNSALRFFNASVSIIPDSLKGYQAIGETYLALGEKQKAMSIYEEILKNSSSPEAAAKVAGILFKSAQGMMDFKNYENAASTFEKIMKIQNLPKDNQYYDAAVINFAISKAKIGEKIRDQNPDDKKSYQGYYKEAISALEPLTTDLHRKDLELTVWDLLVQLYPNIGENKKAEDALAKANELRKNKGNK